MFGPPPQKSPRLQKKSPPKKQKHTHTHSRLTEVIIRRHSSSSVASSGSACEAKRVAKLHHEYSFVKNNKRNYLNPPRRHILEKEGRNRQRRGFHAPGGRPVHKGKDLPPLFIGKSAGGGHVAQHADRYGERRVWGKAWVGKSAKRRKKTE